MATKHTSESPITALDAIFSCFICQKTLSEVYRNPENTKGFTDGRDSNHDAIVTKLWVTECAHLICGEHFEGGGVPFHPEGQPPRAPCPACALAEKPDARPRSLYSIRGFGDNERDPQIPAEWFVTPPIPLGTSGRGMEALRFQYLSLARFGQESHRRLRLQKRKREAANEKVTQLEASHHKLEEEMRHLSDKAKKCEKLEAELQSWKRREPAITHYLGVVAAMAKENDLLKQQLTCLGYAVPNTNYAMQVPGNDNLLEAADREEEPKHRRDDEDVEMHNSDLAKSAATERDRNQSRGRVALELSSSSTLVDRQDRQQPGLHNSHHYRTASSKKRKKEGDDHYMDLDGPQAPLACPKSSRDLMPPPLVSTSRQRSGQQVRGEPELQIYEDGQWQKPPLNGLHARGVQAPHFDDDDTQAYLSTGALPVRRPVDLPSVRPMDESGVEIHARNASGTDDRSQLPFLQPLQRPQPSRRSIQPAQSVREPSTRTFQERLPLVDRDNQDNYFSQQLMTDRAYAPLSEAHRDCLNRQHRLDPRTPARQAQRPESVASPFFKQPQFESHNVRDGREIRRLESRRAEPGQLMNRSYRVLPARSIYNEPRNLNDLSFITEPYSRSNEPLHHDHPQSLFSDVSLNSDRLFRRPDIPPSPYERSTYRPIESRTVSRMRQAAPLPATMPSAFSRAIPSRRGFTQDGALSTIKGARSGPSYVPSQNRYGRRDVCPARAVFSSAGTRRMVRR